MARDDLARMYLAQVQTLDGVVDHYVVALSAEEAAEEVENDDRWRDRRPIAILRLTHRGATVWTPPDPLDAAPAAGPE